MPTKKKTVKTYLDPEEFAQLSASAAMVDLSVSTFVKNVCLGFKVRSTIDQKALLALLKANADLGRVAGLLKLAITENAGPVSELRATLEKIEQEKSNLAKAIAPIINKFSKK